MSRRTRPHRVKTYLVLAAFVLLAGGCGVLPKGHTSVDVSAKDYGIASWYGEDFHGKLAADGNRRQALDEVHAAAAGVREKRGAPRRDGRERQVGCDERRVQRETSAAPPPTSAPSMVA